MSILEHLCRNGIFQQWTLPGSNVPERYFWYTAGWANGYNLLKGGERGRRLERDLTEKGRISGLINDFVSGVPRVRMVRPIGYGAEPIAKRLDPPRDAIVYFRTSEISGKHPSPGVRCYGLFRAPNVFYAMSIMRKERRNERLPQDPVDPYVAKIMALLGQAYSEVDVMTHVENLITP